MKIKKLEEAFHLLDDDGTSLCIVYFSTDPGQANASKRLLEPAARRLIQMIARYLALPEPAAILGIRDGEGK